MIYKIAYVRTMYYEPLKERLSSVCKKAYRKVSKVKTPREK